MNWVVYNSEPFEYSERAVSHIKAHADYYSGSLEELTDDALCSNIHVLIVRLKRYIDASVLDRFPNLKIIISATTGLDHISKPDLQKRQIQLLSLRDEIGFLRTIPSTGEFTWGLLLSIVRNIPGAVQAVKGGQWERDHFRGYQLKNKSIGIIGLGRVGYHVAGYAKAFGMQVKYYDPYVDTTDYEKCETLDLLLNTSDVISLHVHLTEETRHLLNAENIAQIKDSAYIINTSRGGLIDEEALADHIRNHKIRGIATDVLACELDEYQESPLYKACLEGYNVIITPHLGGASFDAMHQCEEFMAQKLIEIISAANEN